MADVRTSQSTSDYPQVKHSQAADYLQEACPVWLLTPQGTVVGANLLTAWLWQARQFNDLLGSNAFAIFSDNLKRMPKHANREFFTKKSALVKRMSHLHGPHHYAPFIHAMKHDPDLKYMYEWDSWEPDNAWADDEWQYKLHIGHPGNDAPPDTLLIFHVTVSGHEKSGGWLIHYEPYNKYTKKMVRKQYQQLSARRDSIEYMQYSKGEVDVDRIAKEVAHSSEIGALAPPFNQEFQEKFREAILCMMQSPAYRRVLEDFRTAYEYRQQFPWLNEDTIDGLAYALQAALASYIVSRPVSEWAERLRIAADATIQDAFSLERFEKRLTRSGINIDTISSEVLQSYIVDALERYYIRRMIGQSPDVI